MSVVLIDFGLATIEKLQADWLGCEVSDASLFSLWIARSSATIHLAADIQASNQDGFRQREQCRD